MEECLKSLLSIHFLDVISNLWSPRPLGECGVIASLVGNPPLKV